MKGKIIRSSSGAMSEIGLLLRAGDPYSRWMFPGTRGWMLVALGLIMPLAVHAQIDPVQRRLIQVGFNAPIQGREPIAAYGFYYLNQPQFYSTNLTLRLAVS